MKYYCIGIKGSGMSTLAQILYDLGNEVSGYDDVREYKYTEVGLKKRNIKIFNDQNHTLEKDMIVTYSVAFNENHPEIKRVKELGLKIVKYNELMGEVISMFTSIGVSGTHGKTTTSSLIKHIIEQEEDCNYFIGAGDGYAKKDNKYFVVESDEFNKHFLAYHPTYAVITNIEAEHLECYKDVNEIRKAFEQFANQTKKAIIANGDNEQVKNIKFKNEVVFYGVDKDNDIIISDIELSQQGSKFALYKDNECLGKYFVPLFGKHMVYDTVAAIILCKELGISNEIIEKALATFHNAKRRLDEEVVKGTIILDDYAHHPTEIRVTLEAIRQKYPNKRLVVVFVPNTYSRTRDFKEEFVEAFKMADKAYLTEIDCNREDPNDYPGINSSYIVNDMENGELISEETIDKLKNEKDSVVCFMGCASVERIKTAFKNIL